MSAAANSSPAPTSDREIVLTRTYDAPRELVWKAWTDPEHIGRWWGPTGFRTTTSSMDVRPGGQWRFMMHGPDGTDYPNLVTYLEVVEPERLVYTHGGDKDVEPVSFTVTATFEKSVTASFGEVGGASGGTKVTLRMVFPTKEDRDFTVREYGALEGGKQTLARLGEHLSSMSSDREHAGHAPRPFVITRVFRAPREVVWRAWTEREQIMRWFGPAGTTIPHCSLDLRPGGAFHYCMRGPDGDEHWGRWVFREIVEPERLVFIGSFSDERGNTRRAPFDESWPMETHSTVTFLPHAGRGGGTVVTIEWSALNASEAEQATFDAGHDIMGQGWSGTMDKLAEYLSQTTPGAS